MKALFDYLRVAVACLGFVILDPAVGDLLAWLPESFKWVTGLVAVAVSAGISWAIFKFLGPFSWVEFSWDDKLTGVRTAGPVLDVDSRASGGQVFAVSLKRTTSTVVARFILNRLVRRGLSNPCMCKFAK